MRLLKKGHFVYFILILTFLCVDSHVDHDEYEKRGKYDDSIENDLKTCNIPWESSMMSEPYSSCWLMCKGRCIILSKTPQWRCKRSTVNDIFANCHCCSDDSVI